LPELPAQGICNKLSCLASPHFQRLRDMRIFRPPHSPGSSFSLLASAVVLAFLTSCAGPGPQQPISPDEQEQLQQESTIESLLQQARRTPADASRLTLDAVDLMIATDAPDRARQTLAA